MEHSGWPPLTAQILKNKGNHNPPTDSSLLALIVSCYCYLIWKLRNKFLFEGILNLENLVEDYQMLTSLNLKEDSSSVRFDPYNGGCFCDSSCLQNGECSSGWLIRSTDMLTSPKSLFRTFIDWSVTWIPRFYNRSADCLVPFAFGNNYSYLLFSPPLDTLFPAFISAFFAECSLLGAPFVLLLMQISFAKRKKKKHNWQSYFLWFFFRGMGNMKDAIFMDIIIH